MLSPGRFRYIDNAKGIAILLVVFRHGVTQFADIMSIETFVRIKQVTSLFDMALFFFFSGITFGISLSKRASPHSTHTLIRTKIFRLIPSYTAVATIIATVVYLVNKLGAGIDKMQFYSSPFYYYVIRPEEATAQFLWFIYVLLLLYIVCSILLYRSNVLDLILLLLSFGAMFLNISSYFAFDKFCHYFFFFSAGCIVYKKHDSFLWLLDKYRLGWIIASILFLLIFQSAHWTIFSMVSILAVANVSRIHFLQTNTMLGDLGQRSFSIYLFNLFVLAGAKYLLLLFGFRLEYDIIWFGLFVVSAVLLPYWFKTLALSRTTLLDPYF